jgi:sugar/nucleoside kinase (ribokinase family)
VVVVVDPTGERTMFADRAAAAQLSTDAAAWVDDVDVLHIPAYAFSGGPTADAALAMAGVVRARGGAVTVDASAASLVFDLGAATFMKLIRDVGATLLFANRDEARALGIDSDRRGTVAVAPGLTVIVKDGARPVRILTAGGLPIEVPGEPVAEVRDTTGAGDAFAAGTLAAWMRGSDLATACRAGHRLAAQVLATPGAGGQPTAQTEGACR